MKTFYQFQEDISQLRRQLSAIERQDAPSQKLATRRRQAQQKSRTAASEFQQRQIEKMQAEKEKAGMQEQIGDVEQTPYTKQVMQSSERRKARLDRHCHQELGQKATREVAAKQERMKQIMK